MISEEQRTRWHRWRDLFSLAAPRSNDFGSLQPAVIGEPVRVRILITPPDPAHDFIDFDNAFWEWWGSDRPDPVNADRQTQWGFVKTPTTYAALRTPGDPRTERRRYLALYRNGAQEVGLLRDAWWPTRQETAVFRMDRILGRFWAAMSLYSHVVDRFGLKGPYETCVALTNTSSAHLGSFAEGWIEPGSGSFHEDELSICQEPNLMWRREIDDWPINEQAVRELVISLGAWLDDSWYTLQRRFLANRGVHKDDLDWSGYRWD